MHGSIVVVDKTLDGQEEGEACRGACCGPGWEGGAHCLGRAQQPWPITASVQGMISFQRGIRGARGLSTVSNLLG